ncbi:hypothetical protein BLA15816_02022 [Burkholderia lata]|nr:hypothetical protein BLA15816_02022 [Burkholderia lata]
MRQAGVDVAWTRAKQAHDEPWLIIRERNSLLHGSTKPLLTENPQA